MKKILFAILLLCSFKSFSQIKNYLFIGMDRDLLKDSNYFKPDLLPYAPEQMTNSYPFIKDSYKKTVSGLAVQDGTFKYINPHTKRKITAVEIYQFAESYLHLTYIFWGTENPFFQSQTIPFLQSVKKQEKFIHTQLHNSAMQGLDTKKTAAGYRKILG